MAEPLLDALRYSCGEGVSFGERVRIGSIGGPAEQVVIGDHVSIGEDVRILAPRVVIGDYTTIHNHTTIYGYDEVRIGECCWIGQNVVLNCSAPLSIGRGVTFSAYSNIWTHFSGGDPLQGCNFESRRGASIGEDAWIGVQCSIAPVNIAPRALVLAGSIVTKDLEENRVYGGNPAVDMTYKIGAPWRERPLEDKFIELCHRLRSFHSARPGDAADEDPLAELLATQQGQMLSPQVLARAVEGVFRLGAITVSMCPHKADGTSIFDLRDRTYSKTSSAEEVAFMRALLPLVKFYPRPS